MNIHFTHILNSLQYCCHNTGIELQDFKFSVLTLNLPTTTTVAQPFNVIKWQLKSNPVA